MMMGGISSSLFALLTRPLTDLGSTAFQPIDGKDDSVLWKGCTPNIARDLAKLKKETLTWLVTQLPDVSLHSCGSTEVSMVSHITNIPVIHWAKSHPWTGKTVEVVCCYHLTHFHTTGL